MALPRSIAVACVLACVLALSGCSDDVGFLSLAGLEDALVVLARVGPDATLREAKIADPAAAPAFFHAESGDTLHAFALERSSIRDAVGQPLASDALAQLTIDLTHDDAPSVGCAPCPFPAAAAPFVLEPGSRCALPPFFEHRQSAAASLDAEALESIRAQLRVARPGACTCPVEQEGAVRGSFTACEVEPAPRTHRWHRVAISNDGAIAAVHPSMILTATAGASPVFHPLSNAFIRPPILAGIGERGRRFLAVGRTLTLQSDTPEEGFVRLDGDAIEAFDPLRETGELVYGALFDPARASMFLLGPSSAGNEARVWRCDEGLAHCTASELPRCGTGPSAATKNLANALSLPSGDILALTLDAHLFQLRPGSDSWECRTSDRSRLRLEGAIQGDPSSLRVDSFSSALVAGDRLFACGDGSSLDGRETPYAIVLSTRLGLAAPQWHDGELSMWVEETANTHCHGLWYDRVNGEVLAFFFHDARTDVFAFDTAGRFLDRREGAGLSSPAQPDRPARPPRFADFEEPVALVAESPDGRSTLVEGIHGALRVIRTDGSTIAIGTGAPDRPAFAIAGGDEALLLGGGGGTPVSWSGGCDASSLQPHAPLDQPAIEAAAGLPDGRVVALSRSEVAIYDRSAGVTERWPLALPALESAAAITGDEVVLLDADGAALVLSLSARSVHALPLESEPGVAGTREVRFQHLAGARGLGFLSGGSELARVRPGLDGLRGELWWGTRVAEALMSAPDPLEVDTFAAPAILCGGRAVISLRAVIHNITRPQYLSRTVLLEPGADREYHPRVLAGFSDQARFGSASFRSLANLISASAQPVLGFADGLVLRPDSDPYFAPNPDLTSIVEVGDGVVLTDRAGLRVFLRAP